jgi:hypothetical protein
MNWLLLGDILFGALGLWGALAVIGLIQTYRALPPELKWMLQIDWNTLFAIIVLPTAWLCARVFA